jgi:putative phosphoserine phosphatase/1-acylglycerol-3-phosphate O-acyltransferase
MRLTCEVEDGQFTGGVVQPTCFGIGKVHAAETFYSASTGSDLDQLLFLQRQHRRH